MMPGLDGNEVLRKLRADDKTVAIPFIFLTAKSDKSSVRQGMERGADDYLTKPYTTNELIGVINTRLQRHAALASHFRPQAREVEEVLTVKDLVINFSEHRVTLRGQDLKLSPQEYALLTLLALNAGQVISHQVALLRIWGPQYANESQYLHVFVSQLRKKIEPEPARPYYILTERGIGYRFRSLSH